jgi:hypothetical protein
MSGSVSRFRRTQSAAVAAVAGNGLMDRRVLLGRGVVLAGAMSTAPLGSLTGAAAEPPADRPLADAPWSLEPGATIQPYEQPSRFEKGVLRTLNNPNGQPGAQGARTPHHLLNGSITPNGLHFVVSWGGAPDINPDKHRLVIHGLVKRPLITSYCIEQFSPNRCMLESNFPVDKVSFSHHVLFNAFKRFSKSYSVSERAALFHDTAARAYRISEPG